MSKRLPLYVLCLCVTFLLAGVVSALDFAPILSSFSRINNANSYDGAASECQQQGAYLATQPSNSARESHLQLASLFSGRWFAFLGGNTLVPESMQDDCRMSQFIAPNNLNGSVVNCIYRWKVGRWVEFNDSHMPIDRLWYFRSGVSFHFGSLATTEEEDLRCSYSPTGSFQTLPCGPLGGFPSFFPIVPNDFIQSRPGANNGRYVIALGDTQTAFWSDNEPTGGYTYEGATLGSQGTLSIHFDRNAISSTVSSFFTLCDVQAPSRTMIEPYNDPNSSADLFWWAIFLALFIAACFIVFLIIACCQEREDADEPPEDAPEWAQNEVDNVQLTRRYVSQRTMSSTLRGSNSFQKNSSASSRSFSKGDSRTTSDSSNFSEDTV